MFGPPRGCFHTENWASCPCHTLAIGERALAMVIRHFYTCKIHRFPRLFKTPSRSHAPSSCLLNFDNTIQALDESAARKKNPWEGWPSYHLPVSIERPSKKWGVKCVFRSMEKLPDNRFEVSHICYCHTCQLLNPNILLYAPVWGVGLQPGVLRVEVACFKICNYHVTDKRQEIQFFWVAQCQCTSVFLQSECQRLPN